MMKKMGTGLRSGTARFLMGSLPSAPWEVRSSALQTHEGHHLLQLEGQSLFPGCIILLQRTDDLPPGRCSRSRTGPVFGWIILGMCEREMLLPGRKSSEQTEQRKKAD